MYKPENAPEITPLFGGYKHAADELESTPIFDALARRSAGADLELPAQAGPLTPRETIEHYIGRHRVDRTCPPEPRRPRLSVVPGQAQPSTEYVPRRLPTVPVGPGGRHRALRAVSH